MAGKGALLLGLYSCVLVFLMFLTTTSHAQTCSDYRFPSNQAFSSCTDLPYLNSFLHWNYDTSTGIGSIILTPFFIHICFLKIS